MIRSDKNQPKNFPYDFPVEFENRAHGNVVARCPLLPGCQAQGKNPKEALEKLRDVLDLYFASAAPAFFEGLEEFSDIPTIYNLTEFKGSLYAATSRDIVLKSGNGAPGSWKKIPVTKMNSKFFNPLPGSKENGKEASGDYLTQVYGLCVYSPPGKEAVLYAATNLHGGIYQTNDGENWREAFSTGEDRIHALCEFKNRLYVGTSSQGKIYAFDGTQWNTVGSLSEVAVTCLGVFNGKLYAGTYPSGLIFSTSDGLNWVEATSTGQNFIQCFREFKGSLYAGTSSPKGVKIYRSANGVDWVGVYESSRELNIYCLEVFEGSLYAGTGSSGRVLRTQDGQDWKTAYAGDQEGVRGFALYNDYLFGCTENGGTLLRSTFDMARIPVLSELKVEKLSSSTALLTWTTDISATSEVHYGEKKNSTDLRKVVIDKGLELRHRIHLTDLKAETEYEFKAVSAYRSSSLSVTETSAFKTMPVAPPALSSPTHPVSGRWEKNANLEIWMNPSQPLVGVYYLLNHYPGTIPAPPEAVYTEEKRVAQDSMAQGNWYFHAVGVDEAGNIGTQASHYRLQIDTEAVPPLELKSSTHPDPDEWVSNPNPAVSWKTPEDLSGVRGFYILADHEPSSVPGPQAGDFTKENNRSLGPLEDGLWYVHLSTQDEAGNLGTQAAHLALRVDTKTTAPSISSPSHPQDGQWYSNNKLEVIFTQPHDLSGVEGYYYHLDQEPQSLPDPSAASFTEKPKASFENLQDGIWYVHVRAKDKAGNISPQAGHFKAQIDTLAAPPKVSSPTHSEDGRWYKDRRVSVQWEDPFDHSGIEGFYYNIDRKSDTIPNDKNSLFTKERSLSFELTDDGLWYFHITTKDKAGNVDWKAVHYALRVDTEAAKAFLSSSTHPDENQWYSNPKVSFKITPPDDLSGITGYYYVFAEEPSKSIDPRSATYTDKTEIGLDIPRDGVHTLAVVSQDAAGNISKETALFRVRLDSSVEAAVISSSSHPDPEKWTPSRRVELVWKDPPDLSGIEGYHHLLNPQEHWQADPKVMVWTTSRSASFTLESDGVWFFHLVAKDKAGNLGAVSTFKIQADSAAQPPLVKSPTHPMGQWGRATTPKFMWDPPSELSGVEGYYVSLDSQAHTVPGPGNGKWTTETSLTAPALKDGKWYFHATTKDRVGNVSKEAFHYPVWIDTAPPKSKMKALPPIVDRTLVTIEWEASDANSEVAHFDVQVKAGNGAWADWLPKTSERSAAFTGKDGEKFSFRCRAQDGAGNLEAYPEEAMASTVIDISPPASVGQLKVSPRAGGDIELKWDPVADKISGTDYYRVYRWTEGGKKEKISVDGDVKGMTYLDRGTGLKENTVYYYSVQAVDKMGNEQHEGNATAASLSDQGVGTPVVTSPTHSSEDWSSNGSPVLVWDAPADATGIAGYYYSLDQAPTAKPDPATCESTDARRLELSEMGNGLWYFHLLAKDRAGNFSDPPAHYRLKIDREKPSHPQVTSETHPDSRRWYSAGKIQFKLSAAPKLSGIDAFYCAFDQEPMTLPIPSEAQRFTEPEVSFKAPEPGVWYLHAAVKDKAGNLSEAAHFRTQVALAELPPPVIACPTHPKEDEASNSHDPLFSWEDRHDGNFTPAGYVYKLSQLEKETLTGDDSFTTETSVTLKNVGEGVWYFHVAAVGKKGKPSGLVSTRRIVVERLSRVHGTFLRKDGVTAVSGAKVEIYKGDKPAASAVTDPQGKFHFANLPEGRYELRFHSDQFPVLRLRDIPVASEEGLPNLALTEDQGIFPTPVAPGPVRFYYFLKEDCNVTLEVFDSTGVLVEKLEEKKEGGAYAVTIWDAIGKAEGEYLYKLSAKSVTKNTMSRFSVKKFRMVKPAKELAPQPVS